MEIPRFTFARRPIIAARLAAASGLTVAAVAASDLWLAPPSDMVASRARLASAVRAFGEGRAADALPVFEASATDPLLGGYARLYAGRAQLALTRFVDAQQTAATVLAGSTTSGPPSDALAEAALWLIVDARTASEDKVGVAKALRQIADRSVSSPSVHLRLMRAAIDAGEREEAAKAFGRLYFDFAGSPESIDAINEGRKAGFVGAAPTEDTYTPSLARAEKLYLSRQYTDGRIAFEALKPIAPRTDRTLIDLRIAEIDFALKKHAAAATGLRLVAEKGGDLAEEASFYYLGTLRETNRIADYAAEVAKYVEKYPASPLAERALGELATYYVVNDEDEKAARVSTDQYARFPSGALADRAAWRAGWWAYKQSQFAETIRIFESAAVAMRRADYRPAWLYWSGRAHMQLGRREAALESYARLIADYRNSYYGRAAVREAGQIRAAMRPAGAGPVSPARLTWTGAIVPSPRPPNASLVEHLLAAEMFDEAIAEIRQLQASGNGSSLLDATLAFALNRQGKLRPAITAMRRAYPQFMSAGGEALPTEILKVIFPVDYWELIQTHAVAKRLDPFLVAALVAQESTFQADVRSSANAWGLMQVLPSTGRQLAVKLGIKPFSTNRLTEPDVNIQLGTKYFADLVGRFGDTAPALAAYNAGSSRVVKWMAERPNFDRDEFIDDIPFPETQNYVKRILGTAEDYRILYGSGRR